METAVRHKIPIIVVVVNNEGNTGALMQKAFYPQEFERVVMFQPDIRYEAIMSAVGGHSEFVEYPEQLIPALERSAASGKPACINVKVDPLTPYPRD
jgi:thiamine pyrophosphate-dependent acetolactate synthase large subunit-like protein